MTPERRQEIDQLITTIPDPDYRIDVEVALVEVLADNDSLTAEIATLKAQVERLKRENRRRAACDLVNDRFKRSIENHEEREGRLKDELTTLKAEMERLEKAKWDAQVEQLEAQREVATLRTKLQAVVEAGEAVTNANSCYAAEEGFVSSIDIDEAIDTLRLTIDKVMGAV